MSQVMVKDGWREQFDPTSNGYEIGNFPHRSGHPRGVDKEFENVFGRRNKKIMKRRTVVIADMLCKY